MKLRTKLYGGLGIIFILITILIVILMGMLRQQNSKMHTIVNELSVRTEAAANIRNEINNMSREVYQVISEPEEDPLVDAKNDWEESEKEINRSIQLLQELDKREQSQELITKFYILYEFYRDDGKQIIYEQRNTEEREILDWSDSNQNKERLLQFVNLLYNLQQQEMKDELFRTKETYNITVKMIYIYAIVGVILSVGIAFWLIRGMTKNLNQVTNVMSNVSQHRGEQFPRITVTSNDEVGAIATAYNEMVSSLEMHTKQEQKLLEKAEEQSWLDSNLAEMTTFYQFAEDYQTLASLFITNIAPMVHAQYGIFYIKKETHNKVVLSRLASYAMDENNSKNQFFLGEGLVGQCASDNKMMHMTDIPDDYVKIQSGIGYSIPKYILLLPIDYEGEVLGVIELATLQPIKEIEGKLLSNVVKQLGIYLNSLRNRMEVKRLLEDSQTMTEELQSQSEELQAQQQELMAINEELQRQYKSSERKNEELESVSKILEEKAQQLVLSSQYKSEFLANMSHELRTPLNSLLILAQMLVEKDNKNLSSKQLEYLQTIYYSGNDLLHLINEILDLAKIESGNMDVIESEVELEEIKTAAERQFLYLAKQKNIDFRIKLDKSLPNTIITDKYRLNQIIKNLLSNAFKFTEKGAVTFSIKTNLTPSENDLALGDSNYLLFTVMDTGIGIPKDKMKLIFEAFQQADGTISRKYGGTGLGLSISKEISALLGGYIDLQSEEGLGSTFTFYLPYKTVQAAKKDSFIEREDRIDDQVEPKEIVSTLDTNLEEVAATSNVKGKKLLIVDDDMRNIFSLSAVLEEYEMDILFAENGKEGINILLNNPDIDLILMDIMMPEMDGFEAMEKIRSFKEFQNLPIIALTAKAMKQNRQACIEAGASDYISKPINLDQLYSLIQVWLYKS